MALEILRVSVVVNAYQHNPAILHPYFLQHARIVPEDWELSGEPITTGALAVVNYSNGIQFLVESNRLQVLDSKPLNPAKSVAPALADAYMTNLPHVRYTAVGVNIDGFVPCQQAGQRLIDRFMKTGPWDTADLSLQGIALRLVYPLDMGKVVLQCDSGRLKRPGEDGEREGLVLNGNYHVDVPESDCLGQAKLAIGRFPQRCEHYIKMVRTILGSEG